MNRKQYVLNLLTIFGPLAFTAMFAMFLVTLFAFPFWDLTVPINRFLSSHLGTWFPGALYVLAAAMLFSCMGWMAAMESGWDKDSFEVNR